MRTPRGSDGDLVIRTAHGREVTTELAGTYLRRLRGMLGRRHLPDALLLRPGNSVHGMGMLVALDVAQLVPGPDDGSYRVLRTCLLRPAGLVGARRGVVAVLEAPRGSFGRWGLAAGDVLHVDQAAAR
ncbi:hypothetical protein [Aquipuribacter hungaricus]|uniref:DUF192 domain-containing protein n=1 Tax=Aquipuribacter hungaricus TaxID=545624 RepID=A0ABV7WJF1_9MICO